MKNIIQFIWEEMNLIQVAKAFAQWIQIVLLIMILLELKNLATLLTYIWYAL